MDFIQKIQEFFASIMKVKKMEKDIDDLKQNLKEQITEFNNLKQKIQGEKPTLNSNIKSSFQTEIHPKEKSAKEIVLNNIDSIKPLLSDLTSKTYDANKWNSLISSFNNLELSSIWSKICGNADAVLRIFAFWGLKPDLCTSFICTGNESEMYEEESLNPLEKGSSYSVLSSCWVYTDENGKKSVIVKGKVKNNVNE